MHHGDESCIYESGCRCHGIGSRGRSKCQQAPGHLPGINELGQLLTNNNVDSSDEVDVAMLTMHCHTLLQLRSDVLIERKHSHRVKLGQLCTNQVREIGAVVS